MGEKSNKIKRALIAIFDGVLDIIYPKEDYCILCSDPDYNIICPKCLNAIKNNSVTVDLNEISDDKIISYGYYGGLLKELILRLKYKDDFTAGCILSDLLVEYIKNNFNYKDFIITYIPLTKKSKKKRGFNQCEYISKKIAYDLNIKSIPLIKKVRETNEQKKLNRSERFKNIKDSFGINDFDLKYNNIIVIDDVTTTGATMNEVYNLLKKYGVKRIKLLTLAKSHI